MFQGIFTEILYNEIIQTDHGIHSSYASRDFIVSLYGSLYDAAKPNANAVNTFSFLVC